MRFGKPIYDLFSWATAAAIEVPSAGAAARGFVAGEPIPEGPLNTLHRYTLGILGYLVQPTYITVPLGICPGASSGAAVTLTGNPLAYALLGAVKLDNLSSSESLVSLMVPWRLLRGGGVDTVTVTVDSVDGAAPDLTLSLIVYDSEGNGGTWTLNEAAATAGEKVLAYVDDPGSTDAFDGDTFATLLVQADWGVTNNPADVIQLSTLKIEFI